MAVSNCKDPNLLAIFGHHISESIPKLGKALKAHFAYNRAGDLPASDGAYVAGVCFQESPATVSTAALTVNPSYAIMAVKPGAVLAIDTPVAASTTGDAIVATGTNYIVGRVVDGISDGTGTLSAPHYTVIKLN